MVIVVVLCELLETLLSFY